MGARKDCKVSESYISKIERYCNLMFPHFICPALIEKELGIDAKTAQKSLSRLLERDIIQRPPGAKRIWYMGKPYPDNITSFEDPEVKIHGMTIKYSLKEKFITTEIPGSPPLLYTPDDYSKLITQKQFIEYFTVNEKMYKITFQCEESCVTVHINASKHQLTQNEWWLCEVWLLGVMTGKGIRAGLLEGDLRKFEMAKDFELITITPKMLSLHDLREKSLIRLYQKYRNLTRLEVSTTWDGDKKIYNLWKEFGQPRGPAKPKEGEDPAFG